MLRQHQRRKPVATLGVYEVPDPRRCGIVSLRHDGMVEQFVEKPDTPIGNLPFSGLMIGAPTMLEAIPEQVPADIGFHVLPKLGGKMLAFPIQDYFLDVGTLVNYQKAQETWPGLPDYAATASDRTLMGKSGVVSPQGIKTGKPGWLARLSVGKLSMLS